MIIAEDSPPSKLLTLFLPPSGGESKTRRGWEFFVDLLQKKDAPKM